jgi:hypothetical protein
MIESHVTTVEKGFMRAAESKVYQLVERPPVQARVRDSRRSKWREPGKPLQQKPAGKPQVAPRGWYFDLAVTYPNRWP